MSTSSCVAPAVELGSLDTLVTVVGGQLAFVPAVPLHELADEDWHLMFDLNLHYVARAVRSALRVFLDQRTGGTIVSVGSITGSAGSPMQAAYGAAKAGLASLGAIRRRRVQPRRDPHERGRLRPDRNAGRPGSRSECDPGVDCYRPLGLVRRGRERRCLPRVPALCLTSPARASWSTAARRLPARSRTVADRTRRRSARRDEQLLVRALDAHRVRVRSDRQVRRRTEPPPQLRRAEVQGLPVRERGAVEDRGRSAEPRRISSHDPLPCAAIRRSACAGFATTECADPSTPFVTGAGPDEPGAQVRGDGPCRTAVRHRPCRCRAARGSGSRPRPLRSTNAPTAVGAIQRRPRPRAGAERAGRCRLGRLQLRLLARAAAARAPRGGAGSGGGGGGCWTGTTTRIGGGSCGMTSATRSKRTSAGVSTKTREGGREPVRAVGVARPAGPFDAGDQLVVGGSGRPVLRWRSLAPPAKRLRLRASDPGGARRTTTRNTRASARCGSTPHA